MTAVTLSLFPLLLPARPQTPCSHSCCQQGPSASCSHSYCQQGPSPRSCGGRGWGLKNLLTILLLPFCLTARVFQKLQFQSLLGFLCESSREVLYSGCPRAHRAAFLL